MTQQNQAPQVDPQDVLNRYRLTEATRATFGFTSVERDVVLARILDALLALPGEGGVKADLEPPARVVMVPYVFAHIAPSGKAELLLPLSVREQIRRASQDAPEVGIRVLEIVSEWALRGLASGLFQTPLVNDLKDGGRDEHD